MTRHRSAATIWGLALLTSMALLVRPAAAHRNISGTDHSSEGGALQLAQKPPPAAAPLGGGGNIPGPPVAPQMPPAGNVPGRPPAEMIAPPGGPVPPAPGAVAPQGDVPLGPRRLRTPQALREP